MAAAMTTWSSLAHSVLIRCFSSPRSLMRIFTLSLAIFPACCNQVDSILGHNWSATNLGISFSCNSMVARVRRAFQVTQGSVETLFRWGGKRLQASAANLFRKQWNFIRIALVLWKILQKHFGLLFFRTLCISDTHHKSVGLPTTWNSSRL